MRSETLRAHLLALRVQCVAAIATLDEALRELEEPAATAAADGGQGGSAACSHPLELRVNTSTLRGPPTFYCKRCGQEIEGSAY